MPVVPFSLQNSAGQDVSFPAGRESLVVFVKEDCPTCREVMPVLSALHSALAESMDIHVIGQTADGNKQLEQEFSPPYSILDDSSLKVSFATDVETVPNLYLTDVDGAQRQVLTGFVRQEWQELLTDLAQQHNANLDLDWSQLPEWRPGCGSLSVDPLIADRLRAESENSPLRARRIEIGSSDDEFEFMFDQGFSDGLPLVPPTPERVLRMLGGTSRDPQEVIATMPPNPSPASSCAAV